MDLGVRSDASFTDRDSLCHSLPAAAAAVRVRPDAVRERVRTSHPSEVAQLIFARDTYVRSPSVIQSGLLTLHLMTLLHRGAP